MPPLCYGKKVSLLFILYIEGCSHESWVICVLLNAASPKILLKQTPTIKKLLEAGYVRMLTSTE